MGMEKGRLTEEEQIRQFTARIQIIVCVVVLAAAILFFR